MEKDIVKSSDNELWMESVRAHSSRPLQGPVGYPLQQQPSQHSSTTVAVGTYGSVADLSGSKESIVIATVESLRATQNKN